MNKDLIKEYIEDLLTVACCPGHDYSCKEVYKYVNQLQSNWNSLREYTEQRLKVLERRINTFGTVNPDKDTKVLQIYQEYLDKMNELEGRDKNE